jgi:H+-translocating NAD(P) transhydrogenase subunit alpha
MIAAIPKETYPGERRVAIVPAALPNLAKAGIEALVEAGAGESAGFPDAEYAESGAKIAASRQDLFSRADVVLQVRTAGANPQAGDADVAMMRQDQVVIGLADPLASAGRMQAVARRGASLLAMELMPRITRAQSMDVLSSQATVAGYKAALLAAHALPRMFPMMMTAAGTISAARVFVIGAGVAGLQAIATAKRLGAIVEAYDVRSAVKEQVQSVGGKFVELPLETGGAEAGGGYAKAMDEAFYRRQRELLAHVVARNNAVITTAAVPGRKAPVLVTADMVKSMAPGSVIVDLAAEGGGNCELTRAGETVVQNGVTILGPTNVPSTVPYHASQMYARNIATFLLHLVKEGKFQWNMEDEITRETLVTRGGQVVNQRVAEAMKQG